MAGVNAGGVTGAENTEYGSSADPEYAGGPEYAAGPEYGSDTGYGADTEYGATGGVGLGAAQGFAPRPAPRAPGGAVRTSAYGSEPVLGGTPHIDEGPPPWASLIPKTPETPETPGVPGGDTGTAARHDPAPAPASAAPRRGRGGQHAARHGKPPRRRRSGQADRSEDPS